jgi:hypothetical protein
VTIGRHGLEELLAYPVLGLDQARAEIIPISLMGVRLLEARLHLKLLVQRDQVVNAAPEANGCREAFAEVIEMAAPLARSPAISNGYTWSTAARCGARAAGCLAS